MNKSERISYLREIKDAVTLFDQRDIENAVITYFLEKYHHAVPITWDPSYNKIRRILQIHNFPAQLEYVIEFFELLLDEAVVEENGIVFTPKYIAEYIVKETLKDINVWDEHYTIIDPGCGCGIFLVTAAEYIHNRFSIPFKTIIEDNIFGMDIETGNARRCKLVLSTLCIQNGELPPEQCHILCCDSLDSVWTEQLNIESCDFIIGNPPYVNPHDLNKKTVEFLKTSFCTTKSGVFNIYYAFIEQAMRYLSAQGTLGFIIPNNVLTIKSAKDLRAYLQNHYFLKEIVDFGDNMVFRPVRTYNCIIHLDTKKRTSFCYATIPSCDDIAERLNEVHFSTMETSQLDPNGWKLADPETRANLDKIEGQPLEIKTFIRTGIATLRDGIYMVEEDQDGFYQMVDGERLKIESELVTTLYKIPELKNNVDLHTIARHIIFPYIKKNGKYVLIPETELKEKYPCTYTYLLTQKEELDCRDKGKPNPAGWYAYGRTQGLNKYGKKLLFPTFSNKPKFTYVEDESCLFCNGYAVFEDPAVPLDILCKILNSSIMDYYVRQTSYPIEGGYYCYQKKYIEHFSIPSLTEKEINFLRDASAEACDVFLIEKYGLNI